MPGSSLSYVIYLLAFARIVVLLTLDELTAPRRDRFLKALKDRDRDRLAYMFGCPWCLSIWLAIPAAPVIYAYANSPWLFVPALGLALSAVSGILGRVKG